MEVAKSMELYLAIISFDVLFLNVTTAIVLPFYGLYFDFGSFGSIFYVTSTSLVI